LADPVIRAVMRADHVDPEALRTSLGEMARRLSQRGPGDERPGVREARFWQPL
jgi:hypothetical protein